MKREVVTYDEIKNLAYNETQEPKEILEWWLVSDWLAEELKKEDEHRSSTLNTEPGGEEPVQDRQSIWIVLSGR
ncbi:hypothetical protein K8T06_05690 [bacterium]|nr:hypothetical protein [bacterium]